MIDFEQQIYVYDSLFSRKMHLFFCNMWVISVFFFKLSIYYDLWELEYEILEVFIDNVTFIKDKVSIIFWINNTIFSRLKQKYNAIYLYLYINLTKVHWISQMRPSHYILAVWFYSINTMLKYMSINLFI